MCEEEVIWDCVVIGLGGHGSATVSHLARDGYKTLGIEKYSKNHGNGSSHGRSRIIRQAYFEDPRYVPLVQRSFELWRELAGYEEENCIARTGEKPKESLLNMTGGLMIGFPDSVVVQGTLNSIATHSLSHQIFSAIELKERYPVLTPPSSEIIGVFETEAGYLIPEACITAHCAIAEENGALLKYQESLLSWKQSEKQPELVEITTDAGRYLTKKLVLTVGAWAPELYGSTINLELRTERRVLYWFRPSNHNDSFKNLPVYIWDTGVDQGDIFYGFPMQGGQPTDAVKVAVHITQGNICSPETIDRNVSPDEIHQIRTLLSAYIPSLGSGELVETATCLYTLTPDEHFLVDFHPNNPNVLIASPCSGHGFKFCSVIGEILKDLSMKGSTTHDISLFSLNGETRNRAL